MANQQITEEMWIEAKDYFDRVRRIYEEIADNTGAAFNFKFIFDPLLIRYNRGERTRRLYDEMTQVEID